MTQQHTETISIAVEGMTCGSCVGRVRTALQDVAGVVEAEVTLRPGTAQVTAVAGVQQDQLIAAVRAAGYRATSGSSASLPVVSPGGSCCN